MTNSTSLARLALGACFALAAAAPSRADFFLVQSGGDFTITNDAPPIIEGTFGHFVFVQEGPLLFDTLLIEFAITTQTPPPDDFAATFTFFDSLGESLTGSIDGERFIDADGTWSGSGAWLVTGGTGPYSGLTGGGSYTFFVLPADGASFSSFEGDVVPAPAAATLMAFAGFAATRRRRTA